MSDINHGTLSKYYVWAKRVRGKSANGGNRHLREVKSAFHWGEDMDVCVCPVRRFPVMREAPAKTKKFTDAELPILLEHARPDFRDMLLFGLLTGLRPQELRGLCREHIRQVGQSMCVVLEKHKASMSMHLGAALAAGAPNRRPSDAETRLLVRVPERPEQALHRGRLPSAARARMQPRGNPAPSTLRAPPLLRNQAGRGGG